MITTLSDWLRRNEKISLFLLVLVFVLVRLPGTALPLHQDEYKWPQIVNPAYQSEVSIPHPPLGELIYRTAGYIVGFNTHFRFVPLFFGALNLLLLYYFIRMLFGRRVAFTASIIWIFSYFSVLASLMVDTDGEILPFFFLLCLIGYYKVRNDFGQSRNQKIFWLLFLVVSALLGFLVKVSFMLAIAAIAADFLWSKRSMLTRGDYIRYGGMTFASLLGLAILLVIAHFIFPFFNLSASLSYWEHFASFHRDWFQTAIQCAKALLYTSPFLVLVPLFASRDILTRDFSRVRPLIFFLGFAFIFYIILFDFSLGALDRYLQLVILPLTVLTSITLVSILRQPDSMADPGTNYRTEHKTKEFALLGSLVALVLVLLQSLPHFVPPLHPKSAWISRVLSLHWNFLYPFSGGSGPLGFYVSFLFIALSWLVCIVVFCLALYSSRRSSHPGRNWKKLLLVCLIPIGLAYNLVFTEEYLFGFWNGYAPGLLRHAVQYIQDDLDIKMVTTYNDNGGNEIREIGKYRKRLYIDPKFDLAGKIATLNMYKEHYFVLDVPRIDPTSVYQKYFNSCVVIYKETDKAMSATIYDCRKAPDLIVQ